MRHEAIVPPEGLDLVSALRKLEHYSRATGIPSRIIDVDGTVLGAFDYTGASAWHESGSENAFCPLCGIDGADDSGEERRAQLFGAYQAERFGGKYIQFCPHSLMFWVAPVISDGIMTAALIGGPVMVMEVDDILVEMRDSGKLSPFREDLMRSALESAVKVHPRRASSLAEILCDVAQALSGSSPLQLLREREEQQANISGHIHEMKVEAKSEADAVPYPLHKEKELLLAISRGAKNVSQRLLNEILGFIFFANGQDPAIVKARVLELVVLLSRAALEGGADMERIFGLNFTYLNQVYRMRSIDDMAHWLSRIMVRFTDLVFTLKDVKHADVMQKALKYVNAHYGEEITLDDVAGAVYLSSTYFSKLFSEEMGCRFTVYLNKVRIEKSKLLLKSTEIPLIDIAGLVGYEDQSYFTKVFKRVTGASPGKYRESGGRLTTSSSEIHETQKDD